MSDSDLLRECRKAVKYAGQYIPEGDSNRLAYTILLAEIDAHLAQPEAAEPLDSLDWNRLRAGQYRALNPDNQDLFDAYWAALRDADELAAPPSPCPVELERYSDALQAIVSWSEAYPLGVFPEPDLKRAREVLESAGLTLDSLSAHAMRHVITQVGKIAQDALAPTGAR